MTFTAWHLLGDSILFAGVAICAVACWRDKRRAAREDAEWQAFIQAHPIGDEERTP